MDNNQITKDPQDKAELMERIHRGWYALERAISDLSDQQIGHSTAGEWSIKDNLTHLAAWEEIMRQCHLHKLPLAEATGLPAEKLHGLNENTLNALLHERDQGKTVPEALTYFRHTHQQLLADLEPLSFDVLMAPRYPEDPQKRPLLGWVIGNTYDHYQEHRDNIQKLIASWK